MPQGDSLLPMAFGAAFIVLGLVGVLWGRHEDQSYFDALAARRDLREFMAHWPERPQSGAVKLGGWIAMVVGLTALVVGIVSWLAAGTP